MKNKNRIRLGVNIDHIATLRQVRGSTTPYPNLVALAKLAVKSGADQITIHLREDRRHIQLKDLVQLSQIPRLSLNLEMASTKEMVALAKKYKPDWICLVPEKRQELTTEGGLDVLQMSDQIRPNLSKLNAKTRVSFFIAPDEKQVQAAAHLGGHAVEFHTGHWVLAKGSAKKKIWQELVKSAELAHRLDLRVHAGHGLDLETTKEIRKLPHLCEVNIGHSIICYSVEWGLEKSIKKVIQALG